MKRIGRIEYVPVPPLPWYAARTGFVLVAAIAGGLVALFLEPAGIPLVFLGVFAPPIVARSVHAVLVHPGRRAHDWE